ncbi:spore coat protein U domain-containing protein [Phenylobacterium sp. LjRoot225]|uniref:spore coat protein U domain-containing protein n=1 Tax=Phenylobacterium sp. LjRoot225 TaxID=3342285 RepID=UPI003ECF886C
MKIALLLATTVLGVAAAQAASAATATSNMSASASVSSVCTMDSTPLAFGEVALTGATPGTATINVTCTGGGGYTVGLGNGLHNVAAQRNLVSGSNILAYDLFKEVGRTTRWGDAGAGLVSGTGTAVQQTLTVYGEVTTGQTLVSGNGTPYTDTVLVTLTY